MYQSVLITRKRLSTNLFVLQIAIPQSLHCELPMKMKKLNAFVRKCKSFCGSRDEEHREETVYVGSSRRRYVIDTKHLQNPLINALIEKSRKGEDEVEGKDRVSINCEVVLFDHLLWMLENADPSILGQGQSLEDLADLYML